LSYLAGDKYLLVLFVKVYTNNNKMTNAADNYFKKVKTLKNEIDKLKST